MVQMNFDHVAAQLLAPAIDRIDALGSLMLDARSEAWSAELCGMIEWPLSTLPPIVQSREIAGRVTDAAGEPSSSWL